VAYMRGLLVLRTVSADFTRDHTTPLRRMTGVIRSSTERSRGCRSALTERRTACTARLETLENFMSIAAPDALSYVAAVGRFIAPM